MTACVAHLVHTPRPTYCEFHHVIPQAWQAFWQPPQPWLNGGASPDHSGLRLWDARTVALCRTGHGNTHFWLVRMTHAYPAGAGIEALPETTNIVRRQARKESMTVGAKDLSIATLALQRWQEAGASVAALQGASLWGEI